MEIEKATVRALFSICSALHNASSKDDTKVIFQKAMDELSVVEKELVASETSTNKKSIILPELASLTAIDGFLDFLVSIDELTNTLSKDGSVSAAAFTVNKLLDIWIDKIVISKKE